MKKQEFQQKLIEVLEGYFHDMTFEPRFIEKVGGASYEAITATVKGSRIGMNMNIETLFRAIENGTSFEDVANGAINCVEECRVYRPEIPYGNIGSYDWIKRRLLLELVPYYDNWQSINKVPHKTCGDMYLICRAQLDEDEEKRVTLVITNEMLGMYGITEEQLFDDAFTYAPQNALPEFENMADVMMELARSGEVPEEYQPDDMVIWVATVESKERGAAVIFYPNFLNHVGQMLGEDFVIIPSSIHECLVIPKRYMSGPRDVEDLIRMVNETEVPEGEELSRKAYLYDVENRVIRFYSEPSVVVWEF